MHSIIQGVLKLMEQNFNVSKTVKRKNFLTETFPGKMYTVFICETLALYSVF